MNKEYLGSKMKYVMDEDDNFIIIPSYKGHDSTNMYHIKSAGFIRFYKYDSSGLGVDCFGESVALKLKANPEHDADIITRSLGFN